MLHGGIAYTVKYFMKNKLTLLLLMLLLLNCSKDEDILSYEISHVSSVIGLANGSLNKISEFEVVFGARNGCGQFAEFTEHIDGDTIYIEVKIKYVDEICTMSIIELTKIYHFVPKSTGVFHLKFKSNANGFITKTLTIQ